MFKVSLSKSFICSTFEETKHKYRKINIKHLAYFSVHETEEWECNYMEQRTGR